MNKVLISCIIILIFSFSIIEGQIPSSSNNYSPNVPVSIPRYFKSIISEFGQNFYKKDSISYIDFCTVNNFLPSDTDNFHTYFTFQILHKLFTCRSASNCSKGKILDIPYFWHWIESNPRFDIRFTANGKFLKDTKPPIEFSNYKSYAEIDRTPYLFLSDLTYDFPKYFTSNCDTFSTFGWCSEREMAFVALLTLFNFEGYVDVLGNHSWSVFFTSMKNTANTLSYIRVIVDNTFDQIEFEIIKPTDLDEFKKDLKYYQTSNWYNKMAHSKPQLIKINNQIVSQIAQERINSKILKYLSNH